MHILFLLMDMKPSMPLGKGTWPDLSTIHECSGPNCETRKWNVLGEIRVGIFAKQDISTGTELSYNYNFEWYGGTKVRCLCGAACCSDFLGAKSRGFQEATYLWEDDDNRYSVDNMPLYDSTDEETDSNFLKAIVLSNEGTTSETETGELLRRAYDTDCMMLSQALPINVEPLSSVPMEVDEGKNEANEQDNFYVQHALQNPGQKSTVVSHIRSKNVFRSYQIQSGPLFKSSPHYSNGKSKNYVRRQVNVKFVCERLASKEACDELLSCEELKNQAASQLDRVYDEIRPAIEERERDSQDSVPTSVAEKWIEASCNKLKAEFDLHSSIIKSILCTPHRSCAQANPHQDLDLENGIKFLEDGQ